MLLLQTSWYASDFSPYDDADLQRCQKALKAVPGLASADQVRKLARYLDEDRDDVCFSRDYYSPIWDDAIVSLARDGFAPQPDDKPPIPSSESSVDHDTNGDDSGNKILDEPKALSDAKINTVPSHDDNAKPNCTAPEAVLATIVGRVYKHGASSTLWTIRRMTTGEYFLRVSCDRRYIFTATGTEVQGDYYFDQAASNALKLVFATNHISPRKIELTPSASQSQGWLAHFGSSDWYFVLEYVH